MTLIKSTMISAMLWLCALGLTAMSPSSHADTQSDLIYSCSAACHNVIVSPSGWSLDGSSSGRTCREKTVSEWLTTIQDMGAKGGFTAIGPIRVTSFHVAAEFLYAKQYTPTPTPTMLDGTPTFTYTPTPTATATATPFCPTIMPPPPPTGCNYVSSVGPDGCVRYVLVCLTTTPTFTRTFTPTPTFTPTAMIGDPHAWYDYDYMGGRCFAKDHTIMERKWCEQHGMKGGGNHPSLTGYDRHAHLDYPGQKP